MAENEVTIDVLLGLETANDRLKKLESAFGQFSSNAEGFFGGMNAAWASFTGNLAADAVKMGFELITEAAREMFDVFVVEGVDAAKEEQKAIHALNEALELSGNFTKEAGRDFEEYAAQISATTPISKEATLQAGALMESLTHLDEEGLKRATSAAIDTSAALGIDLDTAVRLIGKSIEGNTQAFKRYGIQIQQTDDPAQALENTLGALEKRFSGTASSQVETYAGATGRLKNEFTNLQASTGSFITQNPIIMKAIDDATKSIEDMEKWVKNNQKSILGWVDEGLVFAVKGLGYTMIALDGTGRALKGFWEIGGLVFDTMMIEVTTFADITVTAMAKAFGWVPQLGPKLKEAQADIKTFSASAREQWTEDGKKIVDTFSNQGILGKAGDDVVAFGDKLQTQAEKHNALLDDENQHEENYAKKSKDIFQQLNDFYTEMNGKRGQDMKSTLSYISTLQGHAAGVFFEIGKAAAVSTATIDGVAAVQKALASAPPPFNIALAAIVGVAAAANIATILAQQPPAKAAFESGGIVGGNSYSGDRIPAMVNSREMILNQQQQAKLFHLANAGGSGGGDVHLHFDTVIGDKTWIDSYIFPALRQAMTARGQRLPAGGIS